MVILSNADSDWWRLKFSDVISVFERGAHKKVVRINFLRKFQKFGFKTINKQKKTGKSCSTTPVHTRHKVNKKGPSPTLFPLE